MWQLPPKNIALSSTDIHVWKANLDIDLSLQNKLWKTLSQEEKLRANRFAFPHLRARYIAARGILRNLLAQYLSISATNIQFVYGEQGKPFLADFPNFKFNLSHSKIPLPKDIFKNIRQNSTSIMLTEQNEVDSLFQSQDPWLDKKWQAKSMISGIVLEDTKRHEVNASIESDST